MHALEALYEYAAQKAIEDCRSEKIDSQLASIFNFHPFLDYLRNQIKPSDSTLLVELAQSNESAIAELCINLMHPLKEDEAIKQFLFESWELFNGKPCQMKIQLLGRLLDYEDLPIEMHKKLFQFVCEDKHQFLSYIISQINGGKEKILEVVMKRLRNNSFPQSKDWMYLCILMGVPYDQKLDAKKLVEECTRHVFLHGPYDCELDALSLIEKYALQGLSMNCAVAEYVRNDLHESYFGPADRII